MHTLKIPHLYLSISLLGLLATYTLLLWPALSGPFLFDDFPNLQNLGIIKNNISGNLGQYLASFVASPGRPLSALSFLINDNAWPSQPFSFKYTNLMIHLLNGGLLFGFLRQLAKASPSLPQSTFWPLLAMAAWLFHPLQISAQMLVVQRMTLLAATCSFAGLWAYVALAQRATTLFSSFFAASILGLATIAAFLCKESGALLPLFAWILNATILRPALADKNHATSLMLRWACIIPSLLLFTALMNMLISPGSFANREFSMVERVMSQMHVIADYLRQIFMPRLSGSGIYFDDYPITRSWLQPISTSLLAFSYLSLIFIALLRRVQWPVFSLAVLWFFAGHLLESTFLNLELYFEHRNYLPLLGPVLGLSSAAFQIGSKAKVGVFLYSLWLAILMMITALQAPIWGNHKLMSTLWTQERPGSLRAIQELTKYQHDSGDLQGAVSTMMNAYDNGMYFAELPLNALQIQCWNSKIKTKQNLLEKSIYAIQNGVVFQSSVLSNLILLRKAVKENACNSLINEAQWFDLTTILLSNQKSKELFESQIRQQRALYYIDERDLDKTMNELEQAYSVAPSIELTQLAAGVLLSAGLFEEATSWLNKGIKLKQPFFDTLMFDPREKSRHLLAVIEKARKNKN